MKKTTIMVGCAGLALTAALAGGAMAQSGRASQADPNSRVSQAEFVQARTARIAAMDANGDGVVSAEEMQAARQARMVEGRERAFGRLDADGDGAISRAEWAQAGEARGEQRAEGRRGHRGGRMMRGGGHGPRGAMMRLDRDGDGVTVAEVQQRAAEQFARLDADGDGFVTAAERQAQRANWQAQRQERRAARQAERAAPAE
jgi:hypothetical protein